MFDRDELLRQVITQLPLERVEFMHDLAAWATPEWVGFVLQITEKVANSVLPEEWSVFPSTAPEMQELMAQPGYVMLRGQATGRESAANGDPPHFPEEQILHFCRLWTMVATDSMTPEVGRLVEIVQEAEERLLASPQDETAQGSLAKASSQLDEALDHVMAQNKELDGLVSIVFLFLFTDDPEQALRIEMRPLVPSDRPTQ